MLGIALPNLVIFAVLVVVALVGMFWGKLPSVATVQGWFSGWTKTATTPKPTRFETIGLLDKAYEFCPDAAYRKALRDAINHLYDQHAG